MKKNEIYAFISKHKELVLFLIIASVSLLWQGCSQTNNVSKNSAHHQKSGSSESIDLLIPDGQSLVPIEVANYETLDSLIGQFGTVDLFSVDPLNLAKNQKIASRVKLLRSPRNPSHFAILVPHQMAQHILQFKGPFVVSVLNPKLASGTNFEKPKGHHSSRVEYE